jgi:hypothetical protein
MKTFTYTPQEVALFREHHDVTPNGVAFDWWLVSADGAGFCLIREPQHTDADIEEAQAYLHRQRDVVGKIRIATLQTPNARFWTFYRHGWVKLTLRPGQTLRCGYSAPDDEGYSYDWSSFEHVGDAVIDSWCNGGRDCDGPIRRTGDSICQLTELRAVEAYHQAHELPDKMAPEPHWMHAGKQIMRPAWEKHRDTRVTDTFAQDMGY